MLTYIIEKDRLLIITDEVYTNLLNFMQTSGANERGGVLLGKVSLDYKTVLVTDISHPSKADQSGRCYFIRKKEPAQKKINTEWKASNGEVNYIGEWHTHPATHLVPSADDKKLVCESLHTSECQFEELFLIIVGMDGSLYVGNQKKSGFKQLQIKE